jgi:hypothetical protein
MVSMTSGPERPDAAKGDQRSPDAMDLKLAGIRVVRFRANNAERMKDGVRSATHRAGRGRGSPGCLELYRPPDLVWATGKEPMSDDPDLPKANHALQVLRQARLSRNEAAAIMVADLVYETAGTGLRTPEIEEARKAAWGAIFALAKTLKDEGFAGPTLWKAALRATESWIELLD